MGSLVLFLGWDFGTVTGVISAEFSRWVFRLKGASCLVAIWGCFGGFKD